jgi:hypothetical protein
LKWSRVIQDAGSSRTGSSAFDFEGDGSAEVVFSDEQNLEIYDGSTGDLLFSFALSSCTFHEYPLVADVDADGNAELVAVANSNCGIGPQQGIYVFGSASENWPASRGLWNQHTYHVTNINDDGSIPAAESINWLQPDLNSYRSQVVTSIVSVPPSVELTRPLEVRGANPVQGRDVVFEVSGREVGVVVFDAAGRAVRVLAGGAEVRWDLRDAAGRDVPAGIYYARRTDRSETVRVTVVR